MGEFAEMKSDGRQPEMHTMRVAGRPVCFGDVGLLAEMRGHCQAINTAFDAAVAEAVGAAVGPLRAALMDAEWCVETELDAPMQPSFECCPMCGGLKPGEELDAEEHEVSDLYASLVGHRKNCALASAIRSAP